MACALKHHTRRGERDPERWQMASQLVTHALIRDAGFTFAARRRGLGRPERRAGLRPPAGARGTTIPATTATHPPALPVRALQPPNPRRTVMTIIPAIRPDPPTAGTTRTRRAAVATRDAGDGDGESRDGDSQGEDFRVRCAAEPRSVRHRRGHGRRHAGRRGLRCRPDARGRRR